MLKNNGELWFEVRGLKLACQSWGDPQDTPVLALHGWMDNSNTFAELAKNLTGIHLLAIDMAGHGKSDYRSPDSHYNIWPDVAEIIGIADQLNLEQFSLLAHSRGAYPSLLCAAAFPKRVKQLVILDAFSYVFDTVATAPQQLAKAIKTDQRYSRLQRTVYSSYEKAIESRVNSRFLTLSRPAVELLAQRGLKEVDGGYSWAADPRLQSVSELYLTDELYRSFLDQIVCNVAVIAGLESFLYEEIAREFERLVDGNPLYSLKGLPGGHHLHLEQGSAEAVAGLINRCFHS